MKKLIFLLLLVPVVSMGQLRVPLYIDASSSTSWDTTTISTTAKACYVCVVHMGSADTLSFTFDNQTSAANEWNYPRKVIKLLAGEVWNSPGMVTIRTLNTKGSATVSKRVFIVY